MFGRLLTKGADVLSLLESLTKGLEDGMKLSISLLDSEVLHDIRGSFVVFLLDTARFYINPPIKSTYFQASSFYLFGKQLLNKSCHAYNELNVLMEPSYFVSVNKKAVNIPDEGSSINQLYLNRRLF